MRTLRKALLCGLIIGLGSACGSATQATPLPTMKPAPPASTQEELDCAGPNTFPTEEAELIWPTLVGVQPSQAVPGESIEILGSGGNLYWDDECGELWVESARDFQLSFDGEPAGTIQCYAGNCRADLTIPEDVLAGVHTIAVEGGSSVDLEVSGDLTPTPMRPRPPTIVNPPAPWRSATSVTMAITSLTCGIPEGAPTMPLLA